MKKVLKWLKQAIQLDGVLHFLACAALVFTFYPILDNVGNAVIVATVVAIAKEYYDLLIKRSNTWKHSLKDILYDAIGIGYAVLFIIYLY